jgi:histidinol-phosphate/aromatic aminotransferase/cobyric acid decarboxylase-like protein
MLRGTPGARRANDPDTVRISSNENPMGPCKEGLEAIAKVAPHGWRYSPFGEQGDFVTAIAEMEVSRKTMWRHTRGRATRCIASLAPSLRLLEAG